MTIRKLSKLFSRGNCCVFGQRGTGKDVVFGNVIARRKGYYISNLDYTDGKYFYPLDLKKLECGMNTYKELIAGEPNFYEWEYPYESDVYISDAGIYFPSQYCGELNNRYKYFPTFFALSRQISRNNVHVNSQALNRTWDKIREQSDTYILCRKCTHIGNLFFVSITIYDTYDSAVRKARPFSLRLPLRASSEAKMMYKLQRDKYYQDNGKIEDRLLVFFNKSKHDTYYFEKYFKGGKQLEKTSC